MENVTADEVQEAVLAAGKTWIDHHECGICGVMVGYRIAGTRLYFDSSCGCADSSQQPRSWQDAADWINMQSSDEWKLKLRERFGIAKGGQ